MIVVCQECGNSAPSSDGFCSSCGVLLEWSSETVAPTPAPPPVTFASPITPTAPNPGPGPGPGPGPASYSYPATAPPAATPSASTPPGGYPPGALPTTGYPPAPPQTSRPHTSHPQPQPYGQQSYPSTPAAGTQQPGTLQPAAPQPSGVLPTHEAVRPAPVQLVTDPQYDGLYCSACGARNAAGRNFCRSCGRPLDVALEVTRKKHWWQRLFTRKTKSKPVAGERPKDFRRRELTPAEAAGAGSKKRKFRWHLPRPQLSRIAPILIVLGMLGYGIGPGRAWLTTHASQLLGTAKTKIDNKPYVPVAPVSANTSSAVPTHDAKALIDGVKDTWWQSADANNGVGQTMTVTFPNPVDIDRIALLSGVAGQDYRTQARVQILAITADGKPGPQVNFTDTADFQNTSVTLRNVTSVSFIVVGSYRGQKGGAIAIRELEFFQHP